MVVTKAFLRMSRILCHRYYNIFRESKCKPQTFMHKLLKRITIRLTSRFSRRSENRFHH